MNEQKYAGFWIRVVASLIDTVLIFLVILPFLIAIYGKEYLDLMWESAYVGMWDILLSYIFPAIAVIMFWVYRSATPGKMMLKMKIVDEKTGGTISTRQGIVRYIGYYVACLPLMLGIIWVGIDKRKRGLHDKMAGTVVIRE
jgi:uncharacterized RDD family membrane protein YckC